MTGSGDGDDTKRPRVKQKKRVTLKFEKSALLLPGERAPDAGDDESGELRLPAAAVAVDKMMERVTGGEPSPPAHDAWERERPIPTPPPPPPPTSGAAAASAFGAEEEGDALSLVDRRGRQSSPAIDLATEMNDRFALGDYTAALRVAELILGRQPEHETATQVSKACREKLAQLYQSRLGALSRVPQVAVDPTDVRWLGLDHKAGFLLSRVDGAHSLAELLDISGMTRLDALKMLVELLDMGAIRFAD